MSTAIGRTLMVVQKLPQRAAVLDRAAVDKDVREAIRKVESRLASYAQRHVVTGWTVDAEFGHDGFDFEIVDHALVGRLRLVRAE